MQPHRTIDLPDELIDEIQFEIPEAPYDSIAHYLRRAVIDFCEKSHYWQEDIGPIRVTSASIEYDLPVSRTFAVVSVLEVSFADTTEQKELVRCQTDDVQYRYWQSTPFSISFYPLDELNETDVSVIAALKPEIYNNTFKFSENILRDFRDAIVAGAKALLYKTPRKPWTDAGQFQMNDGLFESKAAEALRRQGRGYSRLPDRSVRKQRVYF